MEKNYEASQNLQVTSLTVLSSKHTFTVKSMSPFAKFSVPRKRKETTTATSLTTILFFIDIFHLADTASAHGAVAHFARNTLIVYKKGVFTVVH